MDRRTQGRKHPRTNTLLWSRFVGTKNKDAKHDRWPHGPCLCHCLSVDLCLFPYLWCSSVCVCLYVCSSISMSVFFFLAVCVSFGLHMSDCLSVYLFIYRICLSIFLFICLSVSLSIRLFGFHAFRLGTHHTVR